MFVSGYDTNNPRSHGLVLHTIVNIGYDVPWQDVNELLIEEPMPFRISYELIAFTDRPNEFEFT